LSVEAVHLLASDASVQAKGSISIDLFSDNNIAVQVDAASRLDGSHNLNRSVEVDLMVALNAPGSLVGWGVGVSGSVVVARHV
jgi:hypothetical protein